MTKEELRAVLAEFGPCNHAVACAVVRLRRQVAAMQAAGAKVELWLTMAEQELDLYDDAWNDLLHSRDASARATNRSDLSERRSILLGTIREVAELFSSPEATP